jgi:hypothetical protein
MPCRVSREFRMFSVKKVMFVVRVSNCDNNLLFQAFDRPWKFSLFHRAN